MQKTLYSVAALTPVLLAAGGWSQTARAYGSTSLVNAQDLYASLQEAVCRNDWDGAIATIGPLIASPEVTSTYREDLIRFRHQLEQYRASRSQFISAPGCVREVVFSQGYSTPIQVQPAETAELDPAMADLRVRSLYGDLQASVCRNDWDGAIEVINPLIGSSSITSTYREQLVHFRAQLQYWRAAEAAMPNVSGCNGIAQTAPPSMPELINQPHWTADSTPSSFQG